MRPGLTSLTSYFSSDWSSLLKSVLIWRRPVSYFFIQGLISQNKILYLINGHNRIMVALLQRWWIAKLRQ